GRERKSSSLTTGLAIKHGRLWKDLLPKASLWLLRKTKACARQEIRPTSFAREITFSGSMRTISCRQTRSQSKWKSLSKVKANEPFFLQLGDTLFSDRTKRALFRLRFGATYLRLNGYNDDGRRISI